LGKEIKGHAKVVEFEANRTFGAEVDKPFPGQLTWRLQPAGSGSSVTASAELEPGGFFGVAGPLVAKSIRDAFSSDLNTLKAKLEAPG
jgi:hypothetical protein